MLSDHILRVAHSRMDRIQWRRLESKGHVASVGVPETLVRNVIFTKQEGEEECILQYLLKILMISLQA